MRAEVAIVGNGVAGYACAARLARHGIRPLLIGRGLPVASAKLTKASLAASALKIVQPSGRVRGPSSGSRTDCSVPRLSSRAPRTASTCTSGTVVACRR